MREIILLKSAFSIIDQMFHKEIRDGESKRSRIIYAILFGDNGDKFKNPEEMNEFIKNLMDPFNNSIASVEHDFDTYYDEYYELYGIEKDDDTQVKSFRLKKLFNAKTYFSKNKSK